MENYTCPNCKEKQDSAVQWQTFSIAYEFALKDAECEEVDRVGGDHESWACPGCGQDLPNDLCEKIVKTLWG